MNLTPREQEILEEIRKPERLTKDGVSAEMLAQFLARMEGSKVETCACLPSWNPAEIFVRDICTIHGTPPSKEKKCKCSNPKRRFFGARGYRDVRCGLPCPKPSPTQEEKKCICHCHDDPKATIVLAHAVNTCSHCSPTPPDAWEECTENDCHCYKYSTQESHAVLCGCHKIQEVDEWEILERFIGGIRRGDDSQHLNRWLHSKKKEWEEQAYYNASMNHQKEHWDCSSTTTLEEVERVVEGMFIEPDAGEYRRYNDGLRDLLSRLKEMRIK